MRVLIASVLMLIGLAGPARADSRVDVNNQDGDAVVDPTYLTTLNLSGSGFQSIKGGHGGIYVFFGTVRSGWQPSKGGQTGVDYFYVPDGESKGNQGYAKFVAFPGSDTAASANGGTIAANGTWSTTINVPGATFQAYDRTGGSRTINCRQVTCGIITVGAHGVSNGRNESFTPVDVEDLYAAGEQPTAASTEVAPETAGTAAPDATESDKGPTTVVAPALTVDRGAARAGHVLSFAAEGLTPRAQVTTVLDDGVAGAGPFLVGDDGRVAGVITLPADLGAGTHELRIFGVDDPPAVSFGVSADVTEPESATSPVATDSSDDWAPRLFVGGAALVLLLAVGRLALSRRRSAHD
jgi:hypothetical protein